MEITLTTQEKEFIEAARDATVVSFGIGSILTGSKPRLEVPGKLVINYEERERPTIIWKMVMEQKRGDF